MATKYFWLDMTAESPNFDWNDLANWWADSAHTVQASALPSSTDDVVIDAPVNVNSGASTPTVASLTCTQSSTYPDISVDITISGLLSLSNGVTINASVTCGSALFGYSASNYGTLTSSGTVEFDNGYNNGGAVVNANCEFVNFGINDGTVNGNCVFSSYASNGLAGVVIGEAEFNITCYNYGSVTPPLGSAVQFKSGSTHASGGSVFGDAEYYDADLDGGTVSGDATLYGSSRVGQNAAGSSVAGDVFLYDSTRVATDVTVGGVARFYDSSYLGNTVDSPPDYPFTINGSAEFYDTSGAWGTITGNASFFGAGVSLSTAGATVVGGVAFFDLPAAAHLLEGTNSFGSVKLPSGVNGSSILGVV